MAIENQTGVAEQKAPTLTSMAMSYFRSRVICAAAQLGVADALGDDVLSVDQLALQCGVNSIALHRLLRALASLGVVTETEPGWFALAPLGRTLRKEEPHSEWAVIIFWADLLADNWNYLTECIRAGDTAVNVRPEEVPSRWSLNPNAKDIFRAVMGTAPAEDYMSIVSGWDFSEYHTVADLGGGGGGLISAILHAYPHLRGLLVDKPETIEAATPRIDKEGLAGRCELLAADLCEAVPPGADVYILKSVLHGFNDEQAIEILLHCRSVVPAQGRVLIVEFVLPDAIDHADAELEFRLMSDLNMLLVTGGKERTTAEWKTVLEAANFTLQSSIPVAGGVFSIIEAAPHGGS